MFGKEKKDKRQDEMIEILGDEYQNYNLVFCSSFGLPVEGATLRSEGRN